ncbi:type IV secretory system conjugative DNA transfer family protein [Helicobacter sp. MIT 14-3879]|uniref:type IV secretory system conjugative DNA transfer family protein n=1 Tax=Helicobacter sp. MIT 14-3879 TaxID=2040649 RepID=UPI000E1EE43D|nr:TraM recognition domain-containing protein [Helicobacter sp. MIT 14-3879]RDU61867.1 hypothetical protein CQA44_08030 [Helicobacter sp. MIT 14-3879]
MIHQQLQELTYSIKQDSFFDLVINDIAVKNTLFAFCIIGAFACFFNNFYLVLTMMIFVVTAICALYLSPKSINKQGNNIIENQPNNKYMLNIGTEIKKFYGDAVKSSKKQDNKIAPILLDAEKIKRHGLIIATIGAGKSVLMKGLTEQIAQLGGGCCVIDGKGTAEFAKEIFGIASAYGREADFIYLNFLDMNNTHTINPLLSGDALALSEILNSLLDGEENEWKSKQKEFMEIVLKLLVYKRDNENLPIDFSILSQYMSFSKILNEMINYRQQIYKSVILDDLVIYTSTTIDMGYEEFLNASEDYIMEKYQLAEKNQAQGIYDVGMAVQQWRSIIIKLKSNYGRIFNTQTPDISMWEIVQRNKILFVTLPTMASDVTPRYLGKLILGLFKAVADQKARFAKEPEIPFVILADEVGSYMPEGFARLMSKSRALGISVFPIFQSFSQIDIVGKLLGGESSERKELVDVIGTHIIMKSMSPEASDYYSKFVKKTKYLEKSYSIKRDFVDSAMGAEQSYSIREEDAILHSEVTAMNNGEMMIILDGELYRAIAQAESSLLNYGKKITYDGKNINTPLPISKYMPKLDFFKMMREYENYKLKKEVA